MLVRDVLLMRHDWIFDVLADLVVYARANGLTATALKAEEALAIARAEAAMTDARDPHDPDDRGVGGPFPTDGCGRPN